MLRLIAAAMALSAGMAAAEDITVGVTPGEHAEIMDEVAKLAAPQGLNIDVVEFSDYVVPNTALADGDLHANSFQHVPFLENQIKDRGFEIVAVAKAGTKVRRISARRRASSTRGWTGLLTKSSAPCSRPETSS